MWFLSAFLSGLGMGISVTVLFMNAEIRKERAECQQEIVDRVLDVETIYKGLKK